MCRIRVPALRDSKKQGKLGLDAGAPTVALYFCMRKVGKPADGPRSPQHFSNRIQHTAAGEHPWVAGKARVRQIRLLAESDEGVASTFLNSYALN